MISYGSNKNNEVQRTLKNKTNFVEKQNVLGQKIGKDNTKKRAICQTIIDYCSHINMLNKYLKKCYLIYYHKIF